MQDFTIQRIHTGPKREKHKNADEMYCLVGYEPEDKIAAADQSRISREIDDDLEAKQWRNDRGAT